MSWERWAFTFAQVRGLSALAPHLPTESPQLKAATYDLVLSSFLLHPSGGCMAGSQAGWLAGCPGGLGGPCTGQRLRGGPSGQTLGNCAVLCPPSALPWLSLCPPSLLVPPNPAAPHGRSADHEVLLQLVRRWPPDIYDVPQLQAAILR